MSDDRDGGEQGSGGRQDAPPEDGEEAQEDREELRDRYQELLQELRVTIPGVEVLFAFLVTTPFASRFGDLDDVGRAGFVVALVTTTLAMLTLTTPVTYHHLSNRLNRRHRIHVAIRLKLAGVGLLGIAILTAAFVILRFVFDTTTAAWITGVVAVAAFGLWVVLPLVDRRAYTRREARRS